MEANVSVTGATEVMRRLRMYDLHITSSSTGNQMHVDLKEQDLYSTIKAGLKIAKISGLRLFLLDGKGIWHEPVIWLTFFNTTLSAYPLEVMIVGREGEIVARLTLHIWQRKNDYWQCRTNNAPVKRAVDPIPVDRHPRRSDFQNKPVDVVYTWVNSDDHEWRKFYSSFAEIESLDTDRFSQKNELMYSIRSLDQYMPWVNRVYILSNCQPPQWFKETNRVRWILHHEIIPEEYLPTFNSHAIETFIHEIPDLSDQFVYLNDDFFVGQPANYFDFFDSHGRSVARLEPHGLVDYLAEITTTDRAEEWQHAAVNGARLIRSEFGILPTRLHEHAPYAIKRELFASMLDEFREHTERTRGSRFRSGSDVSFASFLYHHYAACRGDCVIIAEPSQMIRPNNFKKAALANRRSKFFCVNDGGSSTKNATYLQFKEKFLKRIFPFKSSAEF